MTIHNVAEAKAQLSRLLDAAMRGEEIVLARAGTPVARLVPIEEPQSRQLGFVAADVPDAFFAPLEGDELDSWS